METLPVSRRFPCSSVNHQILGLFGNLWVEIVHQHAQRRFLLPAFAGNLRAARRAKGPFGQTRLTEGFRSDGAHANSSVAHLSAGPSDLHGAAATSHPQD